ncbi:MAG: hypothetical protein HQK65_06245 [Desulfamplus sp.]|nr:hypothetical protein [Desulfamplus sp.]
MEGDFSERYLQAPVSYSGGFFLRVNKPGINILFEPGNGTINGMRDLRINLAKETDIIIVSHYHPSARLDLHTIFNELGGYCPGRVQQSTKNCVNKQSDADIRKVYLFSSKAVIQGRADHPSILIPSDKKVIKKSIIAESYKYWKITKTADQCQVSDLMPFNKDKIDFILKECSPYEIILMTFPAYHSECIDSDANWDQEGLEGKHLSCFYLYFKAGSESENNNDALNGVGILFTGDTQYPTNDEWKNGLGKLKGRVTVLIANMKTIEYLSQNETKKTSKADKSDNSNSAIDWEKLKLTQNQLGFEGVKRLAALLNPQALVIRALGLECVVTQIDDRLVYKPEKLSIIQKAMFHLLVEKEKEPLSPKTQYVIIPGRHQIKMTANNQIQEKVIVPAFPPMGSRKYGSSNHPYFCFNEKIVEHIDNCIQLLNTNEKPYIVIIGDTGIGKTHLAESMAIEILSKKVINYCEAILSPDNLELDSKAFQDIFINQDGKNENGDMESKIVNWILNDHLTGDIIYSILYKNNALGSITKLHRSISSVQKRSLKTLITKLYKCIDKKEPIKNLVDLDEIILSDYITKNYIDYYDLATVEKDSNDFWKDLCGYPEGTYAGLRAQEGHKGYLSTKDGILILNQLERLPASENKKFLDLIDRWEFRQQLDNRSSGKSKNKKDNIPKREKVMVKLIFTTNVPINDLTEFREDIKNRLRGRCLELPGLSTMDKNQYREFIMNFINHWAIQHNVLLDSGAYQQLIQIDLKHGAFRQLNSILHKAKSMMETSLRLDRSAWRNDGESIEVFISSDIMSQAIALINGPKSKLSRSGNITEIMDSEIMNSEIMDSPGQLSNVKHFNINPDSSSNSNQALRENRQISLEQIWKISVWLSHGCIMDKTHKTFRSFAGQSKNNFQSKPVVLKLLKDTLKSFKSETNSADILWKIFSNTVNELNEDKGILSIESYVKLLYNKLSWRPHGREQLYEKPDSKITDWFVPHILECSEENGYGNGKRSRWEIKNKADVDVWLNDPKKESLLFEKWLKERSIALKKNLSVEATYKRFCQIYNSLVC